MYALINRLENTYVTFYKTMNEARKAMNNDINFLERDNLIIEGNSARCLNESFGYELWKIINVPKKYICVEINESSIPKIKAYHFDDKATALREMKIKYNRIKSLADSCCEIDIDNGFAYTDYYTWNIVEVK